MNSRRSSLNSSRSRCSEISAKLKISKKPEWDNTISDLNSYKPSPEELERRRLKMQAKPRPSGKVDVYSRLYKNGPNLNGENSKERNFLQNIFCDETSFWEAIAKSDKAMSMVQDLFGDTAKHSRKKVNELPPKHRGLPRVTQAPLSANSDAFMQHTARSKQSPNQLSRSQDSFKSHGNSRSSDSKVSKVSVILPSEEHELKTNLDHVSAAVTRAAALNDSSSSSDSEEHLTNSHSSDSEDSEERCEPSSHHKDRLRHRESTPSKCCGKKKKKQPQRHPTKHSPTNNELQRFKEFLAQEKIQDQLEQENANNSILRQDDRQNWRPINRNNNFRRTPENNPDNDKSPSPIVSHHPVNPEQTSTPVDAAHQGLVEGQRLRAERRRSSSSNRSSQDAWCSTGTTEATIQQLHQKIEKKDAIAPVRRLIEQLEKEALTQKPLNPEDNNNERIRQAVSQLRLVSLPNDETEQMTKLSHRMITALKRLLNEKDNTIQDLDGQIKKLRELVDVLTMELITTNEKADKLIQNFSDYKSESESQISRLKTLVYSQMGIRDCERYSRLTTQSISASSSQASNRPCDHLETVAAAIEDNEDKETPRPTSSTPRVAEGKVSCKIEETDIEHSLTQSRLKSFIKLPVPMIRNDVN